MPKTFAERWRGIPGHSYEQGFDLRFWPQRLEQPMRWTRPRMIFVNSMSDLFHEDVPLDYIERVGLAGAYIWRAIWIIGQAPGAIYTLWRIQRTKGRA